MYGYYFPFHTLQSNNCYSCKPLKEYKFLDFSISLALFIALTGPPNDNEIQIIRFLLTVKQLVFLQLKYSRTNKSLFL